MGIWPSNGHMIHGFEIKVSRGDFLSEMKDPTKSQAVFKFCNRWSVVTPTGLIKAEELPQTWGWMTFDGRSMRTVKQAPALSPEPLTAGFVAAMLRRSGEADAGLIAAAVRAETERLVKERENAVERAVNDYKRRSATKAERGVKRLEAYEAIFGKMETWEIESLKPYLDIVRSIGTKNGWHEVRNAALTIARAGETLRLALDNIDDLL